MRFSNPLWLLILICSLSSPMRAASVGGEAIGEDLCATKLRGGHVAPKNVVEAPLLGLQPGGGPKFQGVLRPVFVSLGEKLENQVSLVLDQESLLVVSPNDFGSQQEYFGIGQGRSDRERFRPVLFVNSIGRTTHERFQSHELYVVPRRSGGVNHSFPPSFYAAFSVRQKDIYDIESGQFSRVGELAIESTVKREFLGPRDGIGHLRLGLRGRLRAADPGEIQMATEFEPQWTASLLLPFDVHAKSIVRKVQFKGQGLEMPQVYVYVQSEQDQVRVFMMDKNTLSHSIAHIKNMGNGEIALTRGRLDRPSQPAYWAELTPISRESFDSGRF